MLEDKIVVKANGVLAPQYYDPFSGEYVECKYMGDKPKVIEVWPGVKAVYIPPELNENPNVEIYADLNKWEAISNIEIYKEKILEEEGKRIMDFADWVCPFLGDCPVIGKCEHPVIKPEANYCCLITGISLEEIFRELGITHKEIYMIKEQIKR